jgi:cobalt/nickel transport protein
MLPNKTLARIALAFIALAIPLMGHFQVLLPGSDIIEDPANTAVSIDCIFCHPFEGALMNMAYPSAFGVVVIGGPEEDLLATLKENSVDGFSAWRSTYKIKQPGDHVFYVEPAPYWEPAEEKFIVHYTKVVVNGFGLEIGWDAEVGLKTEIIPLTRPYGLYAGNIFQGVVLVDGKPAPFTEVEVEYYNKDGTYTAVSGPFVTQVIKADANGIFSYAMPVAGWWGFAALSEAKEKMVRKPDGGSYPVEIGALIWVKTVEMR